ncbi:MAG: hypothetical protein NTY86_10420 [Deltaproteobacteria bacterium]|nr:hypothetical protein [Deltaproteobacteria bacterium]
MPEITLEGVVYRTTYRSTKYTKPVIFINKKDHPRLKIWWLENKIDTNIESLPHPVLHTLCPQIQAESTAKDIEDGTMVKIIIDVANRKRQEKPHIGIRTVEIQAV